MSSTLQTLFNELKDIDAVRHDVQTCRYCVAIWIRQNFSCELPSCFPSKRLQAPLAAWRFEFFVNTPAGTRSAGSGSFDFVLGE